METYMRYNSNRSNNNHRRRTGPKVDALRGLAEETEVEEDEAAGLSSAVCPDTLRLVPVPARDFLKVRTQAACSVRFLAGQHPAHNKDDQPTPVFVVVLAVSEATATIIMPIYRRHEFGFPQVQVESKIPVVYYH